ncbi:nitrogen fixation protein NifZ [Rhodopseudomonas palustris]|uniref:Nitrogen fixation protein NifZ n=3 Tax=Rhodopseudomonas TaxID=1073 RepID=A0A336JUP4_9BRAD|nr:MULTISPECIES: nitrogen fixation protein NifZ [Rhodopseudomonas]AVT83492.1 NifZ protein [Rhodopseudomonas palustris]RED22377.1 nitrogen fixation protein NifZ [Rhodopseudomonas pentothenatexigens]REF88702.1 nitrogen fixation protein NifZ [Rhodopseudomonas thermotolerans]UYO39519.1 nitrogen fixation protein NifZ [Rhodopseudomonas palustris]UYO44236.1 nitrogen fixation protein NifZ [Rhodopseudomonas palustris]
MTPEPRYQWGQRVRAEIDLFNDGSFPDQPEDALLVKSGDPGEIVRIGLHTETNRPVYLVEFAEHRVIGCLEDEITPL